MTSRGCSISIPQDFCFILILLGGLIPRWKWSCEQKSPLQKAVRMSQSYSQDLVKPVQSITSSLAHQMWHLALQESRKKLHWNLSQFIHRWISPLQDRAPPCSRWIIASYCTVPSYTLNKILIREPGTKWTKTMELKPALGKTFHSELILKVCTTLLSPTHQRISLTILDSFYFLIWSYFPLWNNFTFKISNYCLATNIESLQPFWTHFFQYV